MLQIIRRVQDLNYSQIMSVYRESNLQFGLEEYPHLPDNLKLMNAEQEFYAYLQDFFRMPGAFCAVWSVEGQYKSALRMEPYEDGYLLAGLETAPEERAKGYAKLLVKSVLNVFRMHSKLPVYSHIAKLNASSVAVHIACGFTCFCENADYIDGTHHTDSATWIWK